MYHLSPNHGTTISITTISTSSSNSTTVHRTPKLPTKSEDRHAVGPIAIRAAS